jgi:hypothetical protein
VEASLHRASVAPDDGAEPVMAAAGRAQQFWPSLWQATLDPYDQE